MKNGMSKRIDWIDSLRALAVFFIVLGHCEEKAYIIICIRFMFRYA